MRRIVVVMALGMVIAALAAPIIPLAIVSLELAELLRCLRSTAGRVSADRDPRGLLRPPFTRTASAAGNGRATAVLLIC